MLFGGGPYPPLYIRGDRVTWKVLAEYSWSPTTIQSSSFLCTAASSTPIRVVTREIRYIHELSLTVEYFMSINNPAAPGLTNTYMQTKSLECETSLISLNELAEKKIAKPPTKK